MTARNSGKRPWLAAALSLLLVGLGHAYLRRWGRALSWFLFAIAAGVALQLVFPASGGAPGEFSLEALLLAPVVPVLSAVDAYRLAKQSRAGATRVVDRGELAANEDGTVNCPHCGRETDPDLDFCQWCTESLRPDADGDDRPEQP